MWQMRMAAFLHGKGQILWDVTVNTAYVHPMNFLAPGSRDMFDANNKGLIGCPTRDIPRTILNHSVHSSRVWFAVRNEMDE
jgi:hypothetical protein